MKTPKQEVARRLATKLDITITSATHLIESYQELLLELLEEYDEVKICDLITLKKQFVESYEKKMPSGDYVTVTSHNKITAVVSEKYRKQ